MIWTLTPYSLEKESLVTLPICSSDWYHQLSTVFTVYKCMSYRVRKAFPKISDGLGIDAFYLKMIMCKGVSEKSTLQKPQKFGKMSIMDHLRE